MLQWKRQRKTIGGHCIKNYDDTHLQTFHGRLFKGNTIENVTVKPDKVFLQT